MKYKCIIFDCDGVLVDSEGLSIQILVDMGNAYGADISLAYALKNFAGTSIEYCRQYIESQAGQNLPDDFTDQFRQKSYQAFDEHLQPIKGVHTLLDTLKLPYCVASSGPLDKIKRNLSIVGLSEKFMGRMYSSYEIGSWKPAPDIFLYAAKQMGFKPCECVVIEDSRAGVQAAHAGGFDVYAYVDDKANNAFTDIDVQTFSHMNMLAGFL